MSAPTRPAVDTQAPAPTRTRVPKWMAVLTVAATVVLVGVAVADLAVNLVALSGRTLPGQQPVAAPAPRARPGRRGARPVGHRHALPGRQHRRGDR